MKDICPVCGYRMPFPPADNNICHCCGTEFGFDDVAKTHEFLRRQWIESGASWFSRVVAPPVGWDPNAQMISAGVGIGLHRPDEKMAPVGRHGVPEIDFRLHSYGISYPDAA